MRLSEELVVLDLQGIRVGDININNNNHMQYIEKIKSLVLAVLSLIIISTYAHAKDNKPTLEGKVILVTGASRGI